MRGKKGISTKLFAVLLAAALTVGCAVGGTVAWLTAKTNPVVNTFTYGDINITLTETKKGPFKILPGNDIEKDPKVTVTAGSEDCWLFVEIEESNWPGLTEQNEDGSSRKVDYQAAEGWEELTGDTLQIPEGTKVYYRTVDASDVLTEAKSFNVLKDNKVTVSKAVTKAEINALRDDAATPTLTFTAYAVQRDGNITSAEQAWKIAANP